MAWIDMVDEEMAEGKLAKLYDKLSRSDHNECHYWVTHHGAALQKLIRDDKKAEEMLNGVLNDYKSAPISAKEKAMLDYAVKLTEKPAAVEKKDLDILRKFKLSDRDILDLNQVVAYFNYVNRTADGLGIELESESQ